ncbi:MAG TPA: phosphoribosyltransferase [Candidatus Jacksonbacteria bacterium]|nr:phosphoribosyltransferase [Candidatus Jacksonbacteria bacterium]
MIFSSRLHAGQQLAQALRHFANDKSVVILALPRGGVPVAAEVARELHTPLDVIICRKIGAPGNPEFAIGAISEAGGLFLNREVIDAYGISQKYIDSTIEAEQEKIKLYQQEFRNLTSSPYEGDAGRGLSHLKNKTVILVDDGAATGMTLKAALDAVKHQNPAKIIVALPVAPPDTARELRKLVDEIIILETPPYFQAVGQFYADFTQVETAEVKKLLGENDE